APKLSSRCHHQRERAARHERVQVAVRWYRQGGKLPQSRHPGRRLRTGHWRLEPQLTYGKEGTSIEDVLARWRSEKTAAYLSNAVAAAERDPTRAKLFRDMAASAEQQATILAKDLKSAPTFSPSSRSRITVLLLGIFGPRAM